MKIVAWAMNLVGYGLFAFALFGLSDTDRYLRKEAELQAAIIRHYELGQSPEVRARAEEHLDRHRNTKSMFPESVTVNVFGAVIGIGLVTISGRWVYARKEPTKQTRPPHLA